MNKDIINGYLKIINETVKNISLKKNEIDKLLYENNQKTIRNEKRYKEIIDEIGQKETKIKSMMDNKYYKYIQLVDFINENNIKELSGFEINKNGALVETPEKRTLNSFYDKQVNSSNKEIIYYFNPEIIYNELEYCFYNINGVPITPEKIIIYYNEFEENFYESYFRYYNRYITNTFTNNFLFTPKNIKKIKFIFNDIVDSKNDLCLLYTNEYSSTDNNNYATLYFSNFNSLKNFNIYKNSNEKIPFKISFSEDNIEYKDIVFTNNEAVISLNNSESFTIRIQSDYENFEREEVTISSSSMLEVSGLTKVDQTNSSFYLNIDGTINDCDIIFPFSSYKILKDEFDKLELDIRDYITEKENLYYLNKQFIIFFKESNEEIKKLKFYDDISILSKDKTFFNIYINLTNNILYIPAFLNNFNSSLSIIYETAKEQIDAKYYTPMLFDISVKG